MAVRKEIVSFDLGSTDVKASGAADTKNRGYKPEGRRPVGENGRALAETLLSPKHLRAVSSEESRIVLSQTVNRRSALRRPVPAFAGGSPCGVED